MGDLNQGNRCPKQDLNRTPPEYKSESLSLEPDFPQVIFR
jgi:hypothetical protein